MVRRHGWQYPAHTYQVVAITVFCVLVTVFYTFLSPFLGHPLKENVASGIFSPVAFAVVFLYIRCMAIDPSDPGIAGLREFAKQSEPSLTANASQVANNLFNIEEGRKGATKKQGFLPLGLYCILEWLVKGDKCRKDGINHQLISDDDLLYCTLCNAEVYKFSKHCRSCDKCVEGFDHHCRWLNNCIGRKNYISFVSLTATCLVMLLLETISGLIVLIRCFTDKHDIRIHLTNKLGNGFSMAPFSALVALCTLAPFLASIPLGELFFFHMLLIRKGITTYEYVIAMRAQDDPRAFVGVGQQSIPSQQGGSNATSWRGLSSVLNLPRHGACCTPRRVKQQGEALSRLDDGTLPCTVDAESTIVVERKAHKSSRHVIKISALKLALLNPKEAAQAATKARESSSVLRPVGFHSFGTSETDCGSTCNVSTRSSMSQDCGPASSQKGTRKGSGNSSLAASPRQDMCKEERDMERLSDHSSSPGSAPLSPLSAERRFGNPNVLRSSVNRMQIKGLGNARPGLQVCSATILPQSSIEHPWICTTPINDGYDASRSNQTSELGRSHIVSVNAHANGENHGNSRMAVYWDRAAGRFRSVPHTKKVSNFLPRTDSAEPWGGPHSVLSPGRYLVNANPAPPQGPLSISAPNRGKENSLKWAGDSSRPVLIPNHIVLPSKGPATFQCQSSASTCRTVQKTLMLSRFTPS